MAKKHARTIARTSSSLDSANEVQNHILRSLPSHESEIIFPKLEFVRLKAHQLLHEVGDTMKSGYFCNTILTSILSVFPDGKSVEVGLVGREGFVGLPLLAGFSTAASRAVIQVEGTAFRISSEHLTALLGQCPILKRELEQFSQIMAMQVAQIGACNRLHDVQERMARWLLMCAERVGSASMPLTQELLAQMLGTRRSTVTVAAGALQKAGLITYSRGNLRIIDRVKLEQAACECYRLVQQQIRQWTDGSSPRSER
jgi:CRP-like cAMP-binding protein